MGGWISKSDEWTDRWTDRMANSIIPLPHFVKLGTKQWDTGNHHTFYMELKFISKHLDRITISFKLNLSTIT